MQTPFFISSLMKGSQQQAKCPKEGSLLQAKFQSKGMCDMLRRCQGIKWKSLKEKGT